MKQNVSAGRQQELLQQLFELIRVRHNSHEQLDQDWLDASERTRQQFSARRQELTRRLIQQHDVLEADYQRRRMAVREEFELQSKLAQNEFEEKLALAARQAKAARSDAEYDWFLSKQRMQKEFEADQIAARDHYKQLKATLKQHGLVFQGLVNQAKSTLARHRCELKFQGGDLLEDPDDSDHLAAHFQAVSQVQELIRQFRKTFWARFNEERWFLIVFLVATIVLAIPLQMAVHNFVLTGITTIGIACVAAWLAWWTSRSLAAKAAYQFCDSFVAAIVMGKQELLAAQEQNKKRREAKLNRLRHQRDSCEAELDEEGQAVLAEIDRGLERRAAELHSWVQKRNDALAQRQVAQEEALAQQFGPRLAHVQEQISQTKQELDKTENADLANRRAEYEARFVALANSWKEGVARVISEASRMCEVSASSRLDYERLDAVHWTPPTIPTDAIQFGALQVDLAELPGGLSEDRRLQIDQRQMELPAALDLANAPSLMIETADGGKPLANKMLRVAMLRMLTAIPAGKLRFTIVDPIGLGQNFSAFMHLADHDEQLVNHRIWTESGHINARLADLTQHMENVIQTYLRNEFKSIQDYNRYAGEVAEAFRVLVIADFPTGFSDEAANRLLSIIGSGPRCGVYTLISVDPKQAMPRNLDLDELRNNTNVLAASEHELRWAKPPLSGFRVQLDGLPSEDKISSILHAVGRHAKQASRVEVPFVDVAPAAQDWWQADSRGGISVALGRAGATKLQSMRLGQGTSQHVLIAGKTGSGKSTLLHAMITNLALNYSPDEVQFYLIDFKKGVEFKAYAEHKLPHARVIAIESEREFGQSVLQRLDLELRRRGDLFRRVGVQSLAGYRDARPDERMPRLLLVIDEFQEFFVKEDKIAQDASLLLDRLVRQGRAFGIHVLLGSQTLAGAYSLARATIGQMAVRIALQCGTGDAHLILSDDNDAARLLRRPGEAIYNDANGLIEGNHPFQVVWLSDVERESYLRELVQREAERLTGNEPPIVFEGNVAAEVSRNGLLRKAWQAPAPQDIPLAPRAWVGEAIAIQEAPAAVFHRRSGGNLMLVGQQEESALGVMASSLLSLAAFSPTDEGKKTRFLILDGIRPESSEAGYWNRLGETADLDLEIYKPRDAVTAVQRLYEEVMDRHGQDDDQRPANFLFLYNLARFRRLQKSEDDFGFGKFGDEQKASPAEQLATILREGPGRGVHTIIWSDTHTNLMRWLDRTSLRDIESRVLFQMSATDSSNLMDSSAAAQLGQFRAILYSEDQGRAERFRPYGVPDDEFLLQIRSLGASPGRHAKTLG